MTAGTRRRPVARPAGGLFRSFFLAGFECSTHVNRLGRRLDLITATGHDRYARADYARLGELGIRTARDGIRWHLVERTPGRYDFSCVLPLVRAARETGTQVIWDLCHYGWPDDLDVFGPEFVSRFAAYAGAVAAFLSAEDDDPPLLAPMNEISYLTWAGGHVGSMSPFARERGMELKRQLVRATIAGVRAIRAVNRRARLFHIDPMCNVVADPGRPEDRPAAEAYRLAQYEAWDMISGRLHPELGGAEAYLDVVGVNYYPDNQWLWAGNVAPATTIDRTHPLYRPVWQMLREVYERYRRPLFIAETGTEDERRSQWLRYIGREVRTAQAAGVPIEGICLYPILNHPGWEDDRHCHNGLWDYADESGRRPIYAPLAQELRRQQRLFTRQGAGHHPTGVAELDG
ncbi:MAG TPA: hypothetical protein VHJ17_07105 [Thermomonospora sp.]|nr:hypothetical protein [Thermomonospora sp.]